MNIITSEAQAEINGKIRPPAKLHHHNFYTSDLAACRHFYEDIAGLPLVAFNVEPFPETPETHAHVVGHAFFGLADGGMMAFMHYPDADLQAKAVGTEQPGTSHIALQVDEEQFAGIQARLENEEYRSTVIDHGAARAIYVRDPDKLLVEFTLETDGMLEVFKQGAKAHDNFSRYLAGDRTPTTVDKIPEKK